MCFSDPELQTGTPALTAMGVPRPYSGGHASVYRISNNGRTWAVRCFIRNLPGLQKRYEAIDLYLGSTALSCKVNFAYQPRGIRIGGAFYPVVKMEWVEGAPLNRHVESLLGNAPALRRLAADWSALIESLRAASVAHGDLYHENVLVAPNGGFKLIDYDGMFVPALAGQTGHEIGHPAYQHPRRSASDFGPDMDRFAAYAIHLAILALSREPDLWMQFNNDDNLLFRRDDFLDPAGSRLFDALFRLRDDAISGRAGILKAACLDAPGSTPRIVDDDDAAAARIDEQAAAANDRAGDGATTAVDAAVLLDAHTSPARTSPAPANLPSWVLDHIKTDAPRATTLQPVRPAHDARRLVPGDIAERLPFVFSFKRSWQRPGEKLVKLVRQQPIFEDDTRIVPVTVTDNNAALGWSVYVIIQMLVLTTIPGMIVVTLLVGLFVFQLVKKTREVETFETYQKLVGTREVEELTPRKIIGHTAAVSSVAFTHDGHHLVSASDDRFAFVWRCETGDRLVGLGPHEQKVTGAIPVGTAHYATASWDQTIRLWHQTGRLEKSFELADVRSRFYAVAASADGTLLAGAIGQRQIRVWDVRSGVELVALKGHARKILSIAFTPDGQQIVSASSDMSLRIWNVNSGRCEKVLYGHTDEVSAVAVSDDGERIASGGNDGQVFVWNARTGKQAQRINARSSEVYALAFAPGTSGFLISGGSDQMIRCWDVSTGQEVGFLIGHSAPVRSVAVSPDRKRIASASEDGVVILWTRDERAALASPAAPTPLYSSTGTLLPALNADAEPAPNGHHCPQCSKPLVALKLSEQFLRCTGFPDCSYTVKI